MDSIFAYINQIIGEAEKVAGLSAAAIFALIAIAQGYFIYRNQKNMVALEEARRKTWEEAIRAEERQTEAMRLLASSMAILAASHNTVIGQVTLLSTIISERIPKRT